MRERYCWLFWGMQWNLPGPLSPGPLCQHARMHVLHKQKKYYSLQREETVPGCTNPTPTSKIMANTVLILATPSNLWAIYLFSTYFLNNYYRSGTVLGDIIMISALKKLHLTYFWNRTKANMLFILASIFTHTATGTIQFGELEQLTVMLIFAKSTFLAWSLRIHCMTII